MYDCHLKAYTDGGMSKLFLCGTKDAGFCTFIPFKATNAEAVERIKGCVEAGHINNTPICQACCAAFRANYQEVTA